VRRVEKQSQLQKFLSILDEKSVPYVSWKNNHELDDYLDGKGDLDLFIPSDYRAAFMFLANENKWIELQNPVASFPSVCHFFRLGNFGKIHHLHVYFQIVTGESWLKEFVLPLDEFLLSNRVKTITNGIWILRPEAQRYIFALRHLMKGGSLSSRLLYRNELISYRKEWEFCGAGTVGWDPELGPFSLSNYYLGARLLQSEIKLPSIITAIRLRWSFAPFLRMSLLTLPIRRFDNLLKRSLNKFIFKQKKVFPRGGLVIAFSGVDGSGKSTMLGTVSQFFSSFITVEQFQLGRPQGWLFESFRKLLSVPREHAASIPGKNNHHSRGLPRAISATILALLRLRNARAAIRSARCGNLVFADRWPTTGLEKMDGPRIATDISTEKGGVIALLGKFEQWVYSRMPRADLCIVLKVGLDSALIRNKARIKEGKESDSEIRQRFEQNQIVQPIAKKVIQFENDGDFEVMRLNLMEVLWKEIASH